MSLLRHALEEERHEKIALADPYGVPTGAVPRVSGFVREVGPRVSYPSLQFDAAIHQALDEYAALVRDAECWRRHVAEQRAQVPR